MHNTRTRMNSVIAIVTRLPQPKIADENTLPIHMHTTEKTIKHHLHNGHSPVDPSHRLAVTTPSMEMTDYLHCCPAVQTTENLLFIRNDINQNPNNQIGKIISQNLRQDLKLILDYYHKHLQFSGGVDEEWMRYLHQFTALADE